jgi:hypothetical protein
VWLENQRGAISSDTDHFGWDHKLRQDETQCAARGKESGTRAEGSA